MSDDNSSRSSDELVSRSGSSNGSLCTDPLNINYFDTDKCLYKGCQHIGADGICLLCDEQDYLYGEGNYDFNDRNVIAHACDNHSNDSTASPYECIVCVFARPPVTRSSGTNTREYPCPPSQVKCHPRSVDGLASSQGFARGATNQSLPPQPAPSILPSVLLPTKLLHANHEARVRASVAESEASVRAERASWRDARRIQLEEIDVRAHEARVQASVAESEARVRASAAERTSWRDAMQIQIEEIDAATRIRLEENDAKYEAHVRASAAESEARV